GLVCVGGTRCDCPNDRAICKPVNGGDEFCCPRGTICVEGRCVCPETEEPVCGDVCCPPGTKCVDGRCLCPDNRPLCVSADGTSATCCPEGTVCIRGACCKLEQACAT